MELACRFWLTFSVTLTSSLSGGETCSATTFSAVYFEANALKSICSATPARAEVMPSAFRHSIRTVAAYRVGSGTGYDIMVGLLPRGKLPVSATLRVPSGFNFSFSYLTEDLESVFPVVALLRIVT